MYAYFKDFHEPGVSDSGLFLTKTSCMAEELYPLACPDIQQDTTIDGEGSVANPSTTPMTWIQWIKHHAWFLAHAVFEMTDLYIHGMHEGMPMNGTRDEDEGVHEE